MISKLSSRILLTVKMGLLLSLTSIADARADWNCDLLMRGLTDPKIALATVQFGTLAPEVISGSASPRWQDFSTLQEVAANFAHAKESSKAAGRIEDFERQVGMIAENLKREYDHDLDYQKWTPLALEYRAGDFELRRVFRHELEQFNALLPTSFKLLLPALPNPVQSLEAVNMQAETLVATLNSNVDQSLPLLNSDFTNLNAYRASLKEQLTNRPESASLLKLQKDFTYPEKVRLSMRRPESSRFWLPRAGFQNQRSTGSSEGVYFPERRSHAEATLLGIDPAHFQSLPLELLPKYGYIRLAESNPLSITNPDVRFYGEDIFDFKAERIKKRSTFTVGDSLCYATTCKDLTFGLYFTPLSYLKDAVFFLRFPLVGEQNQLEIYKPYSAIPYNTSYLELQIFGQLSLDDVEQFTFSRAEPTGEFLAELRAREIRIKDGRIDSDHPVDYIPPIPRDENYVPLLKR